MEKQQEEQQRRIAILTKQLITPSETASVTKKKEAVNSVSQQVRSVITDINNINRKHWAGVDPTKVDVNQLNVPMPPIVRGNILAFFDQIENQLVSEDGYNLSEHLPGPMNDIGAGKKYADVKAILAQIMRHTNAGTNHMLWMDFQNNYCNQNGVANFVQPVISFTRNNTRKPILTNHVILSDPEDCERIARMHVQKMPDQSLFLHTGVLTQLDNDRWKAQRSHLIEAFLPMQSLTGLFHLSDARARKANGFLKNQARAGTVQMNEFLLNETMAQLMIVMFGLPDEMVEKNNKKVRNAFATQLEMTGGSVGGAKADMDQEATAAAAMDLLGFIGDFLEVAQHKSGISENVKYGRKVDGPLSARIWDISEDVEEKIFNAATFVFAGHDTTANTMSWLLYEVCRNKSIQEKLRAEVNAMFDSIKPGETFNYSHMEKLPYMTRCLAETLRMWPVVPNGTFRALQFDDIVKGPGGKDVTLKKGTYVQVTNWMRHRSTELWGPDAGTYNPDRDFTPGELWNGNPFKAYNPQSARFSPFTFAPRHCMGMNFAQMEMRVILCHLFRNFDFELGGPTKEADPASYVGVNRATLGPRDTGIDESKPAVLGMYLKVTPIR
jgi:cytochrome P450